MAFIIWPDDKTVQEFKIAKGGIVISGTGFMPDAEVEKLGHRMFAVHPDENVHCTKDENDNYWYAGKPLKEAAMPMSEQHLRTVEIALDDNG